MHELLILTAQNPARYQSGLNQFKWGVTMVGVAAIMGAVGLLFSKQKDPLKAVSPTVKWLGVGFLTAVGCGVIGYARLAF